MSLPNSMVPLLFFISSILFTHLPGYTLCAVVSLSSIEIFKSHEWLRATTTVYFLCQGENKTVLPDVKRAHAFYAFNGEESWQPLSNFSSKKCKRCGLYEEDSITSDDVFDEWEFCPSDFTSRGEYTRFKEKEFNATFVCPECISLAGVSSSSNEQNHGKGMLIAVVILLSALVSVVGVVVAYKFWVKKRREQDQARFLKLFEDGDDIGDELGLGGGI